ncbi:unnamed protein product, partial [Mesorhabditis spiculigera]
MGSAEAECEFLNRLLVTLPQHDLSFTCHVGDGPIVISCGEVMPGAPAAPLANPEYCAVFEQIAHIPRISFDLHYHFKNCWVSALEVATLILEAALVTYRPIGGTARMMSIRIDSRYGHDQQPAEYSLTDALRNLLENSVSTADEISINRETLIRCRSDWPTADTVVIVLAQNFEPGNLELRREKIRLANYKCLEKWPKHQQTDISRQ